MKFTVLIQFSIRYALKYVHRTFKNELLTIKSEAKRKEIENRNRMCESLLLLVDGCRILPCQDSVPVQNIRFLINTSQC